ncbi:MAG: peroxide stress protein YaaA [Gammaproteobacteria bacterium]
MLVILSPAKTLDYSVKNPDKFSAPNFLKESRELAALLKSKEPHEIASLMNLSDKLSVLNFERYQAWSGLTSVSEVSKSAISVFKGDVYQGLRAETMGKKDIEFAQKHLRILSGLYGELKPLDIIEPYRLEMGTKLQNNKGKNLYDFWGNKVLKNIEEELQAMNSDLLINLASNEYFSVLGKIPASIKVVSPVFKDRKNDQYKVTSFFAKKARGLMARWIIDNQLTEVNRISDFSEEGYYFSKIDSTKSTPIFLRD